MAISFIRTVNDVVRAKNAIAAIISDVGLIAKLEAAGHREPRRHSGYRRRGNGCARRPRHEVAPEKMPLIQNSDPPRSIFAALS